MDLPEYPFHEVAELFPLMEGEALNDLKADIAANGLREPVWLYGGAIIDGRNRYRACRELKRPVETREWDGEPAGLVSFVVSLNLKRRHLDESQRAMIAGRLARMRRGDNQHAGTAPSINSNEHGQICPPSRADAAKLLNVSRRSVTSAKKVQRDGIPELNRAVDAGEATVAAAAVVAELPKTEQAEVVAAGPTAIIRHAAEVREKKQATRVPSAPSKPDPRQWSATADGDMFSSPLRRAMEEIKLSGGIAHYAGVMTKKQKAVVVKKLRALIADIESWIETLESDHV